MHTLTNDKIEMLTEELQELFEKYNSGTIDDSLQIISIMEEFIERKNESVSWAIDNKD